MKFNLQTINLERFCNFYSLITETADAINRIVNDALIHAKDFPCLPIALVIVEGLDQGKKVI